MKKHQCSGDTCAVRYKQKRIVVSGILIVVIVLFIIAGIFLLNRFGNNNRVTRSVQITDTHVTSTDSVPGSTDGAEIYPAVTGAGSYREYAPKLVGQEARTILDFSASWCSSCQAFEADIARNMDKIPSDVMILRVDYDTRSDLRHKYGIRTQNTFVEIDRDGAPVKTVIGGTTLQGIIDEFNL